MNNNGFHNGQGITGYGSPYAQDFAPTQPSKGVPIPSNTVGITAQRTFHKINRTLAPGPLAKIVIGLQQLRL